MLPRLNSEHMSSDVRVVRLGPDDAMRYVYLRQRLVEYDWLRMGALHGLEMLTPGAVHGLLADGRSATFGAEARSDSALVSIATVVRTTHSRYAHRARLLYVFTDEEYRGGGFGAAAVSAAVDCARGWAGVDFVDLCVTEDALPAQRLYERLGFVAWGRQAEAADCNGRRIGDVHMSLRLNGAHR